MIPLCYVIAIVFGALIYIFFFWKINWIMDLTKQNKKCSAKYKLPHKYIRGQLPPVYPNGWWGLIESPSLKKGQVEHVAALGQNFAVFRTEKGVARVMDAYCPHLGANMAEGGAVRGEELECHFHSWRFCGETGKCTSIPYSKYPPPSSAKVKVWESMEVNETIFVWYHAESAAPDWYPEPIDNIANGTWKYQGRNEFYISCHIQDIPENGADWSHLSSIHKAAFLHSDLSPKLMCHSWNDLSWTAKSSTLPDEERDRAKHIAVTRLRHTVDLFEKYTILDLRCVAEQVGPGYVEVYLQTAFGPVCVIQIITPLQPFLHKLSHRVFAPTVLAPYSRLVLFGETLIFKRDVMVWNKKKFVDKPVIVNEEANIKKYRQWFKQFYTENSPTYESCLENSLEW